MPKSLTRLSSFMMGSKNNKNHLINASDMNSLSFLKIVTNWISIALTLKNVVQNL